MMMQMRFSHICTMYAACCQQEVSEEEEEDEEFERPVGKYKSNERFMITVTKGEDSDDSGIELIPYKRHIYVASIADGGPFYTTAIDRGDQILSINGRKTKDIRDVAHAMSIMDNKRKLTLFVCRPDPYADKGYQFVIANT